MGDSTKVTFWAQSQREGWLCERYGKTDTPTSTRTLPPTSAQSHLVTIITDTLSCNISSAEAAQRTNLLVTTCIDINAGTLFMNLLGLQFSAAESFDDEVILQHLVDYIVALASLPDAVNNGPTAQIVDVIVMGDKKERRVDVGEVFELDEGRLWRDLPGFGWHLTERLQGPESYLYSRSSPATSEEAKAKWRSINIYIALLAKSPQAQDIPVLEGFARLGIRTLAMALEYSTDTSVGRNLGCHGPAAMQWLKIAGGEIEKLCIVRAEHWCGGDLWVARGGDSLCDEARWRFWKARLVELGYDEESMHAGQHY